MREKENPHQSLFQRRTGQFEHTLMQEDESEMAESGYGPNFGELSGRD